MNAIERYLEWCNDPYFDEETRAELKSLAAEINDRFYRDLEFGTGGLRGVIGAGTNRMNVYTVRKASQGLSNFVLEEDGAAKGIVIAYDSRHKSDVFAKEAALCFCANGIRTYLFESLRPTPELSFALRELGAKAGIVITASHNPAEYNGYKVYWEDGAQITAPKDKQIIERVNAISDFGEVKTMSENDARANGLLTMIGEGMDKKYIDALKTLIMNKEVIAEQGDKLKIVYTPLHGTGNVPVRRILSEIGFTKVSVVAEQEQPDGSFPTVPYPNPEDKRAFELALSQAKKEQADIVLATDPDADRLGIYARDKRTGEYMPFTGNMSGMIICEYLMEMRRRKNEIPDNAAIVTTIVSGKMSRAIAREYGASVVETLTGFKYIGEQIKLFEESGRYSYMFGYEESYGCLVGTYARDKDAVVAVMSLCEAAAYYKSKGMTLWDKMLELFEKYGYYNEDLFTITMKGMDGAARIAAIMENFRNAVPSEIGGMRVKEFRDYGKGIIKELETGAERASELPSSNVLYFELENDAWCCVRPSGTEPKIKFYIGTRGTSLEGAQASTAALKAALTALIPE